MTNQSLFFKIENKKNIKETMEYASDEAFARALNIKSHSKLTELMYSLHRKYNGDDINKTTRKHTDVPATINFDTDKDHYFYEDGRTCRKQGIRRDIYESVVSFSYKYELLSGVNVLDNNDPDIDDFLMSMRKRKLPTATNRDIVSAMLPDNIRYKQAYENALKALSALEQSIVIRKNIDYLKFLNPITTEAFGIPPQKGSEYVTGDSIRDFIDWKLNQSGNGPKSPSNGPKDPDDEPKNQSDSSKD